MVLLAIATVLSVWQLQFYGSPVTPSATGGEVDPVTVLAPALMLVSLVLGGLLLFPLVTPFGERWAARRRGADAVLATRSVGRRRALVATPLVVVALACGQFAMAGGYSASWATSFSTAQGIRTGTPVRISSDLSTVSDGDIDRMAGITGVTRHRPGRHRQPPGVRGVVLLGRHPTDDPRLRKQHWRRNRPEEDGLCHRRLSRFPPTPRPGGNLTLTMTAPGFVDPPAVSIWIANDGGCFARYLSR